MSDLPDRFSGLRAENTYRNGVHEASRSESPDNGRDFLERILDGVFRRRWLIISVAVLVIAGAGAYTLSQEPEYDASSLILLDLQTQWSRAQNDKPASGDYFAENDRTLEGELFVIQASGRINERVRERLGSAVGIATRNSESGPRVRFLPAEEEINAIRVVATSSRADEASLLANLYADEYVRLTKEAGRMSVSTSREQLEEQETKYQAELEAVERQIEQYLEANGAGGLDQTSSYIVSQIGKLEAQRDDVQIELRQRRVSMESMQAEIDNINPSIIDQLSSGSDEAIRAYQQQIAKLELERDAIRMNYPDTDNAEVQARLGRIDSQLDRLRAEIRTRSEQYVENTLRDGGLAADEDGIGAVARFSQQVLTDRIALQGLEAQSEIVESRLAEYEQRLTAIPRHSTELAQLRRRQEHAEQMYNRVVQRLQQITVEEESNPGYARVLRQASVPSVPARPQHARTIALATVFGLLLGCGLAAVLERFDNRIYKPDEILEQGNTVLGVIPDMQPLLLEDHGGAERLQRGRHSLASNLVMLHNPSSAVAEAYRQTRTNVLFGQNGDVVRTLMVTGPGMTDGKTVTATNLAISLAQSGKRTLIVDADLRRPAVHSRFDVPQKPGLVEALRSGSVGAMRTEIENLYVLPAGDTTGDAMTNGAGTIAAELLGSTAMTSLLQRMKEEYDVVIVDTPPILAATDAAVMSTQCDATLLVVRAGKTRETEMNYAVKVLSDVHAPVIGAILNGFDLTKAYGYTYRYPGYTRYGMYSKYGYYGDERDEPNGIGTPADWARSGVEIFENTFHTRSERNDNAI